MNIFNKECLTAVPTKDFFQLEKIFSPSAKRFANKITIVIILRSLGFRVTSIFFLGVSPIHI